MAASQFLRLNDNSVLATANIQRMYLEKDTVVFDLFNGLSVRDAWAFAGGAAAYAAYLSLLDLGDPAGTGIVPNIFNIQQWSASYQWPATLYGTGFAAANHPTLTFKSATGPGTTTFVGQNLTVVSPLTITFNATTSDPSSYTVDTYTVEYSDDTLAAPVLVTGGATIIDQAYVNMQTYYGEDDAPTSDPVDPAVAAFYRGRLHNTLWMWDTEEGAWFPVVGAS